MDRFAGLDVIVDDTGRIVREVKVASEPEALLQVVTDRRKMRRVMHDCG
jgi:hypothetical protein